MSTIASYFRVTAIIPARDEALAIGNVIRSLQHLNIDNRRLIDQIIVVNNCSRDDTASIARQQGAMVVNEPEPGYGSACMAGIRSIDQTDIVVFVDGDQSCCIQDVAALYTAVVDDADLAIGSRTLGYIEPDSMTLVQRLGTALICRLMRFRTGIVVTDLGPLRMMRYEKLLELNMRDRRFGWTAEMQIKAYRKGLKVVEVPTTVRPRIGRSKISGTWRGTLMATHDLLRAVLFTH